jgi:peptide deformylase
MAIKKIVQIGNPVLKAPNRSVVDFDGPLLKQLIKNLKDTMHNEGLIGIAAPQIGENYQVFITHPSKTKYRKLECVDKLRVYVNPIITFFSNERSIIYEGCGCVNDVHEFGPVERSKEIEITAFDQFGKKFNLRCDGILARVIQHEYDHLQGIEFLERISDHKTIVTRYYYQKNIRRSKLQAEVSRITIAEFKYV